MYLKLPLTIAALLLLPIAVAAQDSADMKELARLEGVWNEAHVHGDAAALDRLWANDFVVTVPNMPFMERADAVGIWRSGKVKFQRYQTSDLRIRVYDNAAVVTGQVERTRLTNGQEVNDVWRFTKVYVRGTNGWQIVAWHASAKAP
jgi:hypothetical protein